MNDEAAISRLLITYGVAIDQRDWALFRTCFVDDVDADYGAIGHWKSCDEITGYMDVTHRPFGPTQHRMTNILVNVDGDRATASTYIDVVLADREGKKFKHGIGRYDDELRCRDGRWLIAKRRFTMALHREVDIRPTTSGALD